MPTPNNSNQSTTTNRAADAARTATDEAARTVRTATKYTVASVRAIAVVASTNHASTQDSRALLHLATHPSCPHPGPRGHGDFYAGRSEVLARRPGLGVLGIAGLACAVPAT